MGNEADVLCETVGSNILPARYPSEEKIVRKSSGKQYTSAVDTRDQPSRHDVVVLTPSLSKPDCRQGPPSAFRSGDHRKSHGDLFVPSPCDNNRDSDRQLSPTFVTGGKIDHHDVFVLKPSQSKPEFCNRPPSSLRTGGDHEYQDIFVLKPSWSQPALGKSRGPTSLRTGGHPEYNDAFVLTPNQEQGSPTRERLSRSESSPAFRCGMPPDPDGKDIFVLKPSDDHAKRERGRPVSSLRTGGHPEYNDLFVLPPSDDKAVRAASGRPTSPAFATGGHPEYNDLYVLPPSDAKVLRKATTRPFSPAFHTGVNLKCNDIFVMKSGQSKKDRGRPVSSLRTGGRPSYNDIFVLPPSDPKAVKAVTGRPFSPSFATGGKPANKDIFVLKPNDGALQDRGRSPLRLKTGRPSEHKDLFVLTPNSKPRAGRTLPRPRSASPAFRCGLKRETRDLFVLTPTDIKQDRGRAPSSLLCGSQRKYDDIFVLAPTTHDKHERKIAPIGTRARSASPAFRTGHRHKREDLFVLTPSDAVDYDRTFYRPPSSLKTGGTVPRNDAFVLTPKVSSAGSTDTKSRKLSSKPFHLSGNGKHDDIFVLDPSLNKADVARAASSLKAGGSVGYNDVFVLTPSHCTSPEPRKKSPSKPFHLSAEGDYNDLFVLDPTLKKPDLARPPSSLKAGSPLRRKDLYNV